MLQCVRCCYSLSHVLIIGPVRSRFSSWIYKFAMFSLFGVNRMQTNSNISRRVSEREKNSNVNIYWRFSFKFLLAMQFLLWWTSISRNIDNFGRTHMCEMAIYGMFATHENNFHRKKWIFQFSTDSAQFCSCLCVFNVYAVWYVAFSCQNLINFKWKYNGIDEDFFCLSASPTKDYINIDFGLGQSIIVNANTTFSMSFCPENCQSSVNLFEWQQQHEQNK